ncbi:MAG: sigma-54-dependent transcriptional regulator [Sedimentibacter sp.]
MDKILIIDDEISICTSIKFALEDKYDVSYTTNPKEGIRKLILNNFDLVLLDLKLGNIDGINILEEIKSIDNSIQVIIMTAFGSIVSSVDAIKKGAYTYLTKPLDLEELDKLIEDAVKDKKKYEKVIYKDNDHSKYNYSGIIGKSPAMKEVFNSIEKLKDVDTSVVIMGESGTGKELVARALHYSGKRKNGNFVEINCAAIPDTLLEEELFGHKKGTFTGAIFDKVGKFEAANNGTIFLDEIGDMSLFLQAKLLRVLQQREYTPLGSNIPIKLNIRFIAATNKDLKKEVEDGNFRNDLYFRLNVFELSLPPLRERTQELPLLFKHFIDIYNKAMSKKIVGLSKEAEEYLLNYDYPGNVRELSNIIERAVLLAKTDVIEVNDLPIENKESIKRKMEVIDISLGNSIGTENLAGLTLQEAEKKLITAALKLNKGHRKHTASMLGISERGLRNKIHEYNIE